MLPVCRMTPILRNLSNPLKNFNIDAHHRPHQDLYTNLVGNFHYLAESSLTTPLAPKSIVAGLSARTGVTLTGSMRFAKQFEGEKSKIVTDRRIILDSAQSKTYTEAKMEEVKRRLKEKGLMKDIPKKPPII